MKLFRVIAKLWRFATCTHLNACRAVVFPDSTEINACTRCGRVLWIIDEGCRRNSPHLMRDRL